MSAECTNQPLDPLMFFSSTTVRELKKTCRRSFQSKSNATLDFESRSKTEEPSCCSESSIEAYSSRPGLAWLGPSLSAIIITVVRIGSKSLETRESERDRQRNQCLKLPLWQNTGSIHLHTRLELGQVSATGLDRTGSDNARKKLFNTEMQARSRNDDIWVVKPLWNLKTWT